MSDEFSRRIAEVLQRRDELGQRRTLRPRPADEDVLDLASNDYLGLARDTRVTAAAARAAIDWGAGSTGSRLVTGTTALHAELEANLADFMRAPAALVFSSGYLANLAVITALADEEVTVFSDRLNHASLIDGCRLSGGLVEVVPHGDAAAYKQALDRWGGEADIIVTDAVFSVDGDLAPLTELYELAHDNDALLVVDEAHSLGVVGPEGRGAVEAAGLADEPGIIRTATLSKSLGSQGGVVLGAPDVIDLLVNTARPFIFDTGLAPASAGAALAALNVLRDEPERAAAVRGNAQLLAEVMRELGVETMEPDAAVVPGFLGQARRALAVTEASRERGVRIGCFRPPSVPRGRSCIRLTSRADLTGDDIARAADVLAQTITALPQ